MARVNITIAIARVWGRLKYLQDEVGVGRDVASETPYKHV